MAVSACNSCQTNCYQSYMREQRELVNERATKEAVELKNNDKAQNVPQNVPNSNRLVDVMA